MTREEVVQAALKVERWCNKNGVASGECDCPFARGENCTISFCMPQEWHLEEHLRTRGLKHDD